MKKINTALIAAAILVICSVILLSPVPPVGRDDLVHHLAVPKLYLKHGSIYEIPSMEFSYYPMNLELLYLIPLYLGNDIVPKFIHFGFGLLTAWLIFCYLRRRTNLTYALIGIILFLSIPIIIKLSITAYVDLGLVFFSYAALLLILKWIENGFNIRYLIFSGVCCGLAMGTKYNGLIIFFLLTLFVPYLRSEDGFMKSVGSGLIYLMIALIVFSPWMIRNLKWTKNPIFPLYNNIFNPSYISGNTHPKKNYGIFTFRSVLYDETTSEIALLPLRIFFQGQDGSAKYFDGQLNPFLLFLPMLAFYRPRDEDHIIIKEKKILLFFPLLFFIFTFLSTVLRVRYLTPMIPPLVILSVFGLKNIADHINKKFMFLIFSVFITINIHYIITQFDYVKPFEYLSGKISRDDYILRYRSEYGPIQYINKNLPENATVLFLFTGNRGYYCDRNYVLDSPTNKTSIFADAVRRSDSPEKMASELRLKGITHFMIRTDLFNSWLSEEFSLKEQTMIRQFFEKYVSKLFFEKGFAVLKVEYPDV